MMNNWGKQMGKYRIIYLSVLLLCLGIEGYTQIITFPKGGDRMKREEALRLLEKQTGYTIALNHTQIDTEEEIIIAAESVSMEEMLTLLLENTGCGYRMNKKHIIVLPLDTIRNRKTVKRVFSDSGDSLYEYTGYVIEAGSREPLSYATVCLLDVSGDILKVGVTDDEGFFRLQTSVIPDSIRISFIGYHTYADEIFSSDTDISVYEIMPDSKLLNEVVVTGSGVQYQVDRNSYIVTPEMRQGSANAQEMLNKIHGVTFDKVSNTVRVGSDGAVLLLVDGLQQSQEYIKTLPVERIHKIEVVNEPSGRFLSEGYSAIINFILKKDFTGYDIYVRNFSIVNPAGTNGDDWPAMEQPGVSLTYTRNKINLYGNFVYGRSRWNTISTKQVEYTNYLTMKSEDSIRTEPNDIYKYKGYYVAAGMNYTISPKHTLSFEADYSYGDISTKNIYTMEVDNVVNISNARNINTTLNETKDKDYIATLFYQGKPSDKLNLYGDISYNYYTNQVDNEYNQNDGVSYIDRNQYEEDKNQIVGNIDVNYKISSVFSLNGGYSGVWRKYNSASLEGETYLDYNEIRNKFFSYLSASPLENLSLKVGTGLEYIKTKNAGMDAGRWSLQPYLQMNYKVNEKLNLNAGYVTDVRYPSLYQLSPMSTSIDTFLTQVGNPDLKSAIRHTVSLRFTFWDRLSLIPTFKYTPQRISDYYSHQGNQFNKTFTNINLKQYVLQILYDQPVGKYFNFRSGAFLYENRAHYLTEKNVIRDWLMYAEGEFYHPKWNFGAELSYSRMLEESLLLQGYQMINMDGWTLTMNKQFLDNRLSVMFTWFLPLDLGVRYNQEKKIETSFYKEKTINRMDNYKNMLFVRLNFRFNSGQVKSSRKQSSLEREEREQRTIGF